MKRRRTLLVVSVGSAILAAQDACYRRAAVAEGGVGGRGRQRDGEGGRGVGLKRSVCERGIAQPCCLGERGREREGRGISWEL